MAQTLGSVAVGTVVKINENGATINYIVVNQGLPSAIYDASCDGTWVLRQDIAEKRAWDSGNSNVLESSDIQSYLNGTWINRYDTDIRNAIKQVKIPYRQGGGKDGVDESGSSGLYCRIFLLSSEEVGWNPQNSPNDGAMLSYFLYGTGSSAKQKRVATLNGSADTWWLRSPYTADTYRVWLIQGDGGNNFWSASTSCGVRPAFILPQDLLVKDNKVIIQPPPPSITVPSVAMQGRPIDVSWSSVEVADSYILQRKADSGEWTQVYAGNDLTYTDTAGSWTTVQYQVCGVFGGTNGAFAQSDPISIIPASALVISGSDGDLGTVTSDISYNVTSDTGNQISLTRTVNGALVASMTVNSGFSYNIPVMDLPTGTGTIVITATVQASSGLVTTTRTWTYTKAAQTFPSEGGIASLSYGTQPIFPQTLAEAVKTIGGPWGGNMSEALDKLAPLMISGARIATGSYTGTGTFGENNQNTLTSPFEPKIVTIVNALNNYERAIFLYKGMGLVTNSTNNGGVAISIYGNSATYNQNTISWYNVNAPVYQMNSEGVEYVFCIIG